MIRNILRTLNKRKNSPAAIEEQFEAARVNYLRDLAKLRKKYAGTLADLTLKYGDACSLKY